MQVKIANLSGTPNNTEEHKTTQKNTKHHDSHSKSLSTLMDLIKVYIDPVVTDARAIESDRLLQKSLPFS